MSNAFDQGDLVKVTATVVASGVTADPAARHFEILAPGTAAVQVTASRVATGVYDTLIDITVPGTWKYRFVGSGAVQAAQSGSFFARAPFTPGD